MKTKICSVCRETKPIDGFSRLRKNKDARRSWCKKCCILNRKTWASENPQKISQYGKDQYIKNPETYKERSRKRYSEKTNECKATGLIYRETHRDGANTRAKEWVKNNRDRHNTRSKRWKVAHPEQGRAHVRKRRARRKGVDECFTAAMERFVRTFWENRCGVCGAHQDEFSRKMPIDHWDCLSDENPLAMANAVLMCDPHNSRKWKYSGEKVFGREVANRIERKIKKQVKAWQNQ